MSLLAAAIAVVPGEQRPARSGDIEAAGLDEFLTVNRDRQLFDLQPKTDAGEETSDA